MRLLLSKKEGEFLINLMEANKPMSRDATMQELLIERIKLAIQLQHNENKSQK